MRPTTSAPNDDMAMMCGRSAVARAPSPAAAPACSSCQPLGGTPASAVLLPPPPEPAAAAAATAAAAAVGAAAAAAAAPVSPRCRRHASEPLMRPDSSSWRRTPSSNTGVAASHRSSAARRMASRRARAEVHPAPPCAPVACAASATATADASHASVTSTRRAATSGHFLVYRRVTSTTSSSPAATM